MKNKFFRTGIISYPIMLLLYLGVFFLTCKAFGNDFDFRERLITAAIFAFQGPGLVWAFSLSIIPRTNYLERTDTARPAFVDVCSSVVDIPQEFDFKRLQTEIASKWTITFFDETENVLKFREKIYFFYSNNGAAAWLKYDNVTGKLYFDCFTLAGMKFDLAKRMQKEIEKCLKNFEPV